jgi:hypothetical protein
MEGINLGARFQIMNDHILAARAQAVPTASKFSSPTMAKNSKTKASSVS